jgi:PAS domain S-box-containing protein
MDNDCVMMINRDITNRKQVEESLLETNRKLNTLLKNSPDKVLVIDLNFDILYSNLVANASSVQENQHKSVLDSVHEEYRDAFKQMIWDVVKNKIPNSIEYQDQNGIWWETRAAQITISSNLNCAMLIIRNITNRKKVEKYMKETHQELEFRIKERTAELEQTYQQLIQRDKLATLGFLVSSIAHEINNPNSFISFNIPILQDYINDILPVLDSHSAKQSGFEICGLPYDEFREDVVNLLENMKHGSQRITETVGNLREYIGSQEEKEFKEVKLKTIIDKGVELCRSKMNTFVSSFDVEIPNPSLKISTIPQSLEQILINLLINAAQSADKPDSWVKLVVASEREKPEWICIEIRDNGCGIESDNLPRIFDPFFTTKKQQAGLGLGLNITKKLAEEIGSTIEVDSQPNIGSCFRLIVPVHRSQ